MKGAFQWSGQNTPKAPASSPDFPGRAAGAATFATPRPHHVASSDYTTARSTESDTRPTATFSGEGHLVDGRKGGRGATICGTCDSTAPGTPADFRPAGGAPGLERPDGSGGRRGSVGKSLGLAGGGVSRSIRPDVEQAEATATRALALEEREHDSGIRVGDKISSSTGEGQGYDGGGDARCVECPDDFVGGEGEGGTAAKLSRRRQSNTGQLRDLVEAWPEAIPVATTDDQRDSSNTGYDEGNGNDTPRGLQQGIAELRKNAARALLSDRSLLAGVFRQLSGAGGQHVRDGLDKVQLVKLFRYARMPLDLSDEEAEGLADAVLQNCGAPTARFASLTTFLVKMADSSDPSIRSASGGAKHAARASSPSRGNHNEPDNFAEEDKKFTPAGSRTRDEAIAQSIRRNILLGRSELRLAAGDDDSRLSCAVHLRGAFRKRRKNPQQHLLAGNRTAAPQEHPVDALLREAWTKHR